MKKFFYVAVLALAMVSCGGNKTANTEATCDSPVATEIIPAAATEVLPAAAPGGEEGGKVATEVIPNEPAK